MSNSTFIKLIALTLLFSFKYINSISQPRYQYIDSVNQYKFLVDSLVGSYHSNPASNLSHAIIHYKCADENNSYGSGGSADLYSDSKTIYQLSCIKGCDTVKTERTFYLKGNKIVLAIIEDESDQGDKKRINYYRDDKYFSLQGAVAERKELADQDLIDGYDILKDFRH